MQHRALRSSLAAAALLAAGGAEAVTINTLDLLTQAEFRLLSEDLGAVMSYKPLIPAEPLGITGFDVGFAVTGTRLEHRDIWRKAAANSTEIPTTLPVLTLRAHKGLPFGIDVGVSYTQIPTTDLRAVGGELRWAFIEGGAVMPAMALRLSTSHLSGVDQLDARTTGADLSISKGLGPLTPYAGVGRVNVVSRPKGTVLLQEEKFGQTKLFAGLNVSLGLFNLAAETDRTGDATSYGFKLGLRF